MIWTLAEVNKLATGNCTGTQAVTTPGSASASYAPRNAPPSSKPSRTAGRLSGLHQPGVGRAGKSVVATTTARYVNTI